MSKEKKDTILTEQRQTAVVEEIKAAMERRAAHAGESGDIMSEMVFGLTAPITVPVFKEPDGFRTAALSGFEEFFFRDVRYGKSDNLILVMYPVDAQEFKYAEFDAVKHGFEAFPVLKEALYTLFGGKDAEKWSTVVDRWFQEREETKRKASEKTEAEKYADNPNWGIF